MPWLRYLAVAVFAWPLPGDVKIEVRQGLPIVTRVFVNGHGPYRFLVDTGTTTNLLEAKLAETIGLTPTYRSELTTPLGITLVPGAGGITVAIGVGMNTVKADSQEFLFFRLNAISQQWPDIKGVLGQSFLSRYDYTLDLRGKRLGFTKHEPSGTRSKLTMLDGRPIVSTSLGHMVLDSGAAELVLFGVEPDARIDDSRELRTFNGSGKSGFIFSEPLIIEGRKIWRGNAVAVPRAPERGVHGLLPVSLFKAVYVSNSEGYVVFD